MSIEREDIEVLKGYFIEKKDHISMELLENKFVLKDDCDDISGALKDKQADIVKNSAVNEQKLNVLVWLTTAVAGGVIAALIKLFFGM